MVIKNVTKFHKILSKVFDLECGTSLDICMYVRINGRTGVTLNAPAIVMTGA